MDEFTKRYMKGIKDVVAAGDDEGLVIIINRLYDAGFQDGTQTTLEEVRAGQWKEELEAA